MNKYSVRMNWFSWLIAVVVFSDLSSQRLCSKNESGWESSGKDTGIEKSHYLPRGPRIKHVCRSASSVLRTSLGTLNDDETDGTWIGIDNIFVIEKFSARNGEVYVLVVETVLTANMSAVG